MILLFRFVEILRDREGLPFLLLFVGPSPAVKGAYSRE